MKKGAQITLTILSLLISLSVSAQTTTFRFSYDLGAFDITGGMVQNPAKEFVIAGLNNSFGPYYGDAMKIDTSGNVVWAKAYTAGFATNFSDIKNVSTGGYIITGSSTSGGGGALLVRIDAAGAVLWAFKYQLPNIPAGNASNEYGNAVIETSDGGFLVGGGVDYFWDGVSANTVDTTSALGFKVNSAGTLLWSKVWTITTANPDEHYVNDVAESADGYFFVGQSSEGSGTLNSNGDYPSNALVIKTSTAGALTYIRRWGAGNTTSQGINAALTLSTGNILLGGFDDVHAFFVSIAGVGGVTPAVIFNRRLNGSGFGNTYLIQDVMENSDGNYSMVGTQISIFPIAFNTMLGKINSTSGAWMFGRTYAPIGLSAILPEGGLCTDQGYYVSMTDQQSGGFNFNIIRTNTIGQINDPSSGCAGTAITPPLGAETVTFSTPASSNYNLMVGSVFTPTVTNLVPTRITHCFNGPAGLSSTASSTNVTCNGACNGTASVTPSGGSGSYTYTWSPSGGNSSSATALCPNTYTCTISDGSTTTTQTFVISQPAVVSATQSQGTIACNGGTTSASVSASGGSGSYTYTWTPSGGNAATASGLGAGTYTATTHDGNNCPTTNTFTITAPPVITLTVSSSPAACGGSNGTATVSASGGTGSYTYAWSPSGGSAANASGLSSGNYTVTVTDANNCVQTQTVTVVASGGPSATAAQSAGVTCFGSSTGTATVSISGGTPNYTVTCASGTVTGTTISNLPAGTYTATVTDANSCVTTTTVTITEPADIVTTATVTPAACGASTGSATVSATGGTGAITYTWSTGASGATLSGVSGGTYTVVSTDANGCKDSIPVTITNTGGPSATAAQSVSVTCNGLSNGTATVNISGGTPNYTVTCASGTVSGTTISNLPAGTYTATVTDAGSCITTATVTITEPPAIAVTFTNNISSACAASTGAVTANATGGTGVITYTWNTGANGQTLSNVPAGTYTVTATDANNCNQNGVVTIGTVNGPTVTAVVTASVTCNGASTGSASVSISGGTPTYTITWSGGATGTTATGQPVGTQTITVLDAGGCVATETVSISGATAITSTVTSSPSGCVNAIGSATVAAGGGTPTYTYTWSNAQTGATATGLATGIYSVTITDANNCAVTNTVSVGVTNPPVATIDSIQNALCNGQNSGIAYASASGGTPGYSYTWSNAFPGPIQYNLPAGTYSIYVTDAAGCKDTASITISEPPTLTATITSFSNENCSSQNGSATAAASGGTPNYSYQWSTGQPGATVNNFPAGTYTVHITDANGCKDSTTATITNVPGPTLTLSGQTNVSCNGAANGSATVTATGGTPTYTYTWSNSTTGSSTSGLNVGTYTATVTDANGCISSTTVAITQPAAILVAVTTTTSPCNAGSNGSASIGAIIGGVSPYSVSWSNGQTGMTATNLSVGTYTATIKDTTGCQVTYTVTLIDNAPVDSLSITGTMCVNDLTISLTAPGGGTIAGPYQWYNTNIPVPTATSSTYTGNTSSINNYSVTWFYHGCRYLTSPNYIIVSQDVGNLPPTNVFSPNDDKINDEFLPFYIGNLGSVAGAMQLLDANIDDYEFTVYDRWGVLMFQTTNVTSMWDGKSSGKDVPDGTYYWMAKYKAKCSKAVGVQNIKGFVELIR